MRANIYSNILPPKRMSHFDEMRAKAGQGKSSENYEAERLRGMAKEFESVMLEIMVKEMRKNVPESPLLGRDTGREIFNEMLDGQYVQMMSERGGIGVADLLVEQLSSKTAPRR